MRIVYLLRVLFSFVLTLRVCEGLNGRRLKESIRPYRREPLQDLVTWDDHSLFVRGEQLMLFAGEFHPFRLPSPDLWLDVFQKIKALGYTGVSFYVNWELLEGEPGTFRAEGIFDLEPFFEAAATAGIYLIARPGPYINAELSGGGFPGWLQRLPVSLRTNATEYLQATDLYTREIGQIIAKAQITNGGPVILFQPENEYSRDLTTVFPNRYYFSYVEDQYRNAGIVVPFIDNEVTQTALFPPGNGLAAVDLYGFDAYPQRYDCGHPYLWPVNQFPTNYVQRFSQAPTDPHTIPEFQGGAPDGWGGVGYDNCALLTNGDFERVYYKNNFAAAITILNLYMTAGGTNWGHMSHPGGYVSYDYGSAITEERQVFREKYSEAKLLANFMKSTPAYYTATAGNLTNGTVSSTVDISVTPLYSNATTLYVVRHASFSSVASTSYTMNVSTSAGSITIPQLGGSFTLNGRDSKIHVANYDVGGVNMVYSSAEVFTWQKYGDRTVLLLYGGLNETHEAAFPSSLASKLTVQGSGVTTRQIGNSSVFQWNVSQQRKVIHLADLDVYLLWRNDVFNYWSLELAAPAPISNYSSLSKSSVIVRAGYLMRTASVSGSTLHLTGDLNSTTVLEVIGAPPNVTSLTFNGSPVILANGTANLTRLIGTIPYQTAQLSLPDLSTLTWHYHDNLPELSSTYSDSAWTSASLTYTNNTVINNTVVPLRTPTSLYATDYGFSGGSLLYRGHFSSYGNETSLALLTQGGTGFGHSVWLNDIFLGSWPGSSANASWTQNFTLPSNLTAGSPYVFTVAVDHMGHDEDSAYQDDMKNPRGILNYTFADRSQRDITWKITGNLHGEQYVDKTRGPLNEAAWYAERQGWHLPGAEVTGEGWEARSPMQGLDKAGAGFYVTEFELDMPKGYDIPLAFFFANATITEPGTPNIWGGQDLNETEPVSNYRAQIFVNGWQFGEYVNNLGPQHSFPVPQGILNYHGSNTLAVSLWALDAEGAHIDGLKLVAGPTVQWAYPEPRLVDSPGWELREGAY